MTGREIRTETTAFHRNSAEITMDFDVGEGHFNGAKRLFEVGHEQKILNKRPRSLDTGPGA